MDSPAMAFFERLRRAARRLSDTNEDEATFSPARADGRRLHHHSPAACIAEREIAPEAFARQKWPRSTSLNSLRHTVTMVVKLSLHRPCIMST